jgi:hypothetical protein
MGRGWWSAHRSGHLAEGDGWVGVRGRAAQSSGDIMGSKERRCIAIGWGQMGRESCWQPHCGQHCVHHGACTNSAGLIGWREDHQRHGVHEISWLEKMRGRKLKWHFVAGF